MPTDALIAFAAGALFGLAYFDELLACGEAIGKTVGRAIVDLIFGDLKW